MLVINVIDIIYSSSYSKIIKSNWSATYIKVQGLEKKEKKLDIVLLDLQLKFH